MYCHMKVGKRTYCLEKDESFQKLPLRGFSSHDEGQLNEIFEPLGPEKGLNSASTCCLSLQYMKSRSCTTR